MNIVTGVGVLDKAVHLLRAVADQPRSLQGLQAATGLPRATAHRLAVALEAHGLLRRDPDGRFDLGPELGALGRIVAERFPLAERALPALERLRYTTGESAQLFVREGANRRCVLSLQSPHALRWIVPEGVLFPLEVGSAGRVLSGTTGGAGWVESVEEREPGVASVSAPVVDAAGAVVAAVSVSGPVERMSRQPGRVFGDRVVAASQEIAALLAPER
jgi:DNA-binding IclR family transcriptional regulator